MKTMNQQDLKDVVRGACFLASGGGGAYETGMQFADNFIPPYYETTGVNVVTVEQAMGLPDVKYGVVAAIIGSPERAKVVKNAEMICNAVEKLAELRGIPKSQIGCVIPVEIGAISSLIACLTAAKLGIPVVDGDGAGRAVPKLSMTSFAVNGVSVNPTVLTGEKGDHVALSISGSAEYSASGSIESLVRPILSMPEFGGMAGLAIWLVELERLDEVLPIQGTLTVCKKLGTLIRRELESAGREGRQPSVNPLLGVLGDAGYELGYLESGVLQGASSTTAGGFDHGTIQVETETGKELKIIFQNESLLLWDGSQPAPAVTAPDLISYLIVPETGDTGQWVYSNGDLMSAAGTLNETLKDASITVVGLRAPDALRDNAGKLEAMHDGLLCNGMMVSLPDSYRSMLEELNYYGKYEPLKPLERV